MAYRCENCGKATVMGISQRHRRGIAGKRWKKRAQETKRTFRPNLQKATVMVGGKPAQMRLCTRCIKRFKKDNLLEKQYLAAHASL
jgi:ribosomal protein L28